jgi:hypothetical protein
MTPTASILADAAQERSVVDTLGRRLTLRKITALDKLRLLKAAGPELAMNQPWLSIAVLAASVAAIDDVPVPRPSTEAQIEAVVGRLGDEGIDAVADMMGPSIDTQEAVLAASAGNLSGTLS